MEEKQEGGFHEAWNCQHTHQEQFCGWVSNRGEWEMWEKKSERDDADLDTGFLSLQYLLSDIWQLVWKSQMPWDISNGIRHPSSHLSVGSDDKACRSQKTFQT